MSRYYCLAAGVTLVPRSNPTCSDDADNSSAVSANPKFSKGYYPLAAGSASIALKKITGNVTTQTSDLIVVTSLCPELKSKVVTAVGKVRMRAAAAACQVQRRVLAPVTSANMNEVFKVVRESPDVNLTVFDAVMISSWIGDSYAGIDLELVVSMFGATVSMLVFQGYPLCIKP
ncbi:hypothetical protein AMAG_13018 [Allomyces macrogynus ATCC 38327]|uniref:Uncharacterized protein n=1 Tax=Allomyces macrogynus (strain ATCC 38327) TaxID=578462 RepID=A0A0L0T125_ALLM3|nr:hypothetical protein AMAG_13018 [Allomyces macrogynus ATCC 38327]|eukprot:KNE68360.1 hypothetical protein AMAG_13018 [Allomyces macrogynus ATCC 38327]